jgi:arsenite methyltransferase
VIEMTIQKAEEKRIKNFVKNRYATIAKKREACCSCNGVTVMEQAKAIGYCADELQEIPPTAVMGLGCGNPAGLASLKKGETVLDLGSGAGVDVFLAANKVGETGWVIGVDMTPEMIRRAKLNARKGGYKNVQFRIGEIENLPVEDESVDVIISNCVINLSPDKERVFAEGFRVLRPGGRMAISDIVTDCELPDDIKSSFAAWAECIGGALQRKEYLSAIRKAGFSRIKVLDEKVFLEKGMSEKIKGRIISIKVEARKARTRRS